MKIILGKIKKQRLVGIPGQTEFTYEMIENRYYDETGIAPVKILHRAENMNERIEAKTVDEMLF